MVTWAMVDTEANNHSADTRVTLLPEPISCVVLALLIVRCFVVAILGMIMATCLA